MHRYAISSMRTVLHLCYVCLQVTVEYRFDGGACVPIRVHTVVISTQHDETVTLEQIREQLLEKVVRVVIPRNLMDDKTVLHLNPSGWFVIGGPMVCYGVVYGMLGGMLYHLMASNILL